MADPPSSVPQVCSSTGPSSQVAHRPYRAASQVVQAASQVRPVHVGVPDGHLPILLFDSGHLVRRVGSLEERVAPTRVAAARLETVPGVLVPNLEGILRHPVPNLARNQPRRVGNFVVNRVESSVDRLDREGNSVDQG